MKLGLEFFGIYFWKFINVNWTDVLCKIEAQQFQELCLGDLGDLCVSKTLLNFLVIEF